MIVPVNGLVAYARTLGFGPTLGQWRSNFWDFPVFVFNCHRTKLAFENCIFRGASFNLIKNLANVFPEKFRYKVFFYRTLLYHCYTPVIEIQGETAWTQLVTVPNWNHFKDNFSLYPLYTYSMTKVCINSKKPTRLVSKGTMFLVLFPVFSCIHCIHTVYLIDIKPQDHHDDTNPIYPHMNLPV